MDLSQEGPDQNFEFSTYAGNQILRTFAFIQFFDPRLQAMDKVCPRGLQFKKFQYSIFA